VVNVALAPAGERTPSLMVGEGLLDAATGELVHLDLRLSKTPAFVDWFWMSVELASTTAAGRTVSSIDAAGSGGVAFVKKRMRLSTKFTNWRSTK
jgi:hypothetical protein